MTPEKKKDLQLFAIGVRESILKPIHSAKSGHPGGSLSAADYLTCLYQNELRIDPKQPRDENRDRFVLSKGQVAPWVYLKNPNAPGQRAFSRCAAPFFLEIRQYSCKKMSCSAQKLLAADHIGSFQVHPSLYATLALCGFFPEENLLRLRHIDSHLQGYPNMTTSPSVEVSTGSLGQRSLRLLAWLKASSIWARCCGSIPCWMMRKRKGLQNI